MLCWTSHGVAEVKSVKQPEGKAQDRPEAAIEVWREGDRVLIGVGVPAAERQAEGATTAGRRSHAAKAGAMTPEERLLLAIFGKGPEDVRQDRPEDGILTMSEAEWLVANMVALRAEAAERSRSLDETLAYVSERCPAVGRS